MGDDLVNTVAAIQIALGNSNRCIGSCCKGCKFEIICNELYKINEEINIAIK